MHSSGAGLSLKKTLLQLVALCLFVSSTVSCGKSGAAWSYHDPSCDDRTWSALAPNFCSGSRQSPINILSARVQPDPGLTPFTFTNFNKNALSKIENTGKTVKVTLASGVAVSGGGLTEPYHSLQFHLHWGKGVYLPGSEHTVDGKRYPMELHIVSVKASHKGSTTSAVGDPTGLAAFGFFIDSTNSAERDKPGAWHALTRYLTRIQKSGTSVPMSPGISLDDLLVGVDRTKYYRYLGSLTTPNCNEAVVWTVFKDPVKICQNLIDLFSSTLYVTGSTTTHLTNNYRSLQSYQRVTSQPEASTSMKGIKGFSF